MKRVVLVVVAVLVMLGGAVVAGRSLLTREPPELPIALRFELTQNRFDEVRRTVEVSMHNDGPAPITVEQVELRAPSFSGVGPVRVDAALPAGGLQVDVPISYGTGVCSGDELKPRSRPAQVRFTVRTEDGRTRTVLLPLPDPEPMLDQLLAVDCRQDFLDRQVTLTFGPWRQEPKGQVSGTVVVKRVGAAGTVTLQEFAGSILLEVLPTPLRGKTPKPYAVLEPGTNEVRIPVVVNGDRCTPHVLAEIKKPYVFPAFVSLDGGEPLYTELTVTPADQAAFKPVIDACAARRTTV
ncbi:hypothetical protein ACWKSP_40525 [Micromonosporaceae bacterium Da 78-11]